MGITSREVTARAENGIGNDIILVDADLFGTGTLAQRPTGDHVGDLYIVQDSPDFYWSIWDGTTWHILGSGTAGSGDVTGPASSTDNAVMRFDGTTGKLAQNSGVTISDNDEVRMAGTVEWDKGADIASAATLTLGIDGNYFDVTGTTTITAVSAKPVGTRVLLQFDGQLQITHNATTLVLKDAQNFLSRAGDHLELVSYDGTNWREVSRSFNAGLSNGGRHFGTYSADPTGLTPLNGDTYFNSAIDLLMFYDSTRAKWLSVEASIIEFGRAGNIGAGAYYRGPGTLAFSDTNGRAALYNGTVVALEYTRDDTDSATFEITAGGTTVTNSTVTSTALSGQDSTLDGDFSQGVVLGVRNQAGGNTVSAGMGWYTIRWRHT